MPEAVLALDAGTTSVRAIVFGPDGANKGEANIPLGISYPSPGCVEQDPGALWDATRGVIKQALAAASMAPTDIAAVGITTQRSCCIVWDQTTGEPVSALISWQDLRGGPRATELQGEGYMVLPQMAASKLEAVVEEIDSGRLRASSGQLLWGSVDTYLAWRLSGGSLHATDPSHGCATGYLDFISGDWNGQLIAAQGFEAGFFPQLVDTAGALGTTSASVFGAEVLIGALVGDQQSAAIAQECVQPGAGKVTYGTSGTCNVCTGPALMAAQGTYPLILSRRGDETLYCIEGMVITAGAAVEWLVDLGVLSSAGEVESLAASVNDTHGVHIVPAFQGLGSPHGNSDRYASIHGLTRGATRAHIARAMLEGIAFRVREMWDQIYSDSDLPRPDAMRVDGGAAMNAAFMQIQADVLGAPVERMAPVEATAVGAAWLAGQAAGVWERSTANPIRRADATFEPAWGADERDQRFANWRQACGLG